MRSFAAADFLPVLLCARAVAQSKVQFDAVFYHIGRGKRLGSGARLSTEAGSVCQPDIAVTRVLVV